MIDARLRLSVFSYVAAAYADRSEAALDFGRDTFSVTLATSSFLYLGFSKPFGAVYCELTTPNTVANTLAFTYWNGTTWTAPTARDLTQGLTRSGWLTWDKPTDWASNAVNGTTMYWVRVAPSVTHTATVVAGINLILCDDYDLQTEFPNVIDTAFLPSGEVSHIKTHTAVRNQVIQDLRTKDLLKQDGTTGEWLNLVPWDLHDIEEIRQAATWLALAKIFFNYSDDPQDHWMGKSKYYEAKYKSTLDALRLSFDQNNDGLKTDNETLPHATVTRLYR